MGAKRVQANKFKLPPPPPPPSSAVLKVSCAFTRAKSIVCKHTHIRVLKTANAGTHKLARRKLTLQLAFFITRFRSLEYRWPLDDKEPVKWNLTLRFIILDSDTDWDAILSGDSLSININSNLTHNDHSFTGMLIDESWGARNPYLTGFQKGVATTNSYTQRRKTPKQTTFSKAPKSFGRLNRKSTGENKGNSRARFNVIKDWVASRSSPTRVR